MLQILSIGLPLMLMTCWLPQMKKRLSQQVFRKMLWALFCVYLAGNLYFTLLSRTPGSGTVVVLEPFRVFRNIADFVPPDFENATGFVRLFLEGASPLTGLILNVMLYYPMGYLLPVLFPRMKGLQAIGIGCGASVLTELAQYCMAMGWCEIDDVIFNTLGAALGVFFLMRQRKKQKL